MDFGPFGPGSLNEYKKDPFLAKTQYSPGYDSQPQIWLLGQSVVGLKILAFRDGS